ncbi:hypothetical protein NECAME_18436, partial [Necator americanus]
VFFALLCYTQTFYVCIWRSQEYRAAFIEQLYLMSCRKPKPSVEATPSPVLRKDNTRYSTSFLEFCSIC